MFDFYVVYLHDRCEVTASVKNISFSSIETYTYFPSNILTFLYNLLLYKNCSSTLRKYTSADLTVKPAPELRRIAESLELHKDESVSTGYTVDL